MKEVRRKLNTGREKEKVNQQKKNDEWKKGKKKENNSWRRMQMRE